MRKTTWLAMAMAAVVALPASARMTPNIAQITLVRAQWWFIPLPFRKWPSRSRSGSRRGAPSQLARFCLSSN